MMMIKLQLTRERIPFDSISQLSIDIWQADGQTCICNCSMQCEMVECAMLAIYWMVQKHKPLCANGGFAHEQEAPAHEKWRRTLPDLGRN